MSNAIKCTSGNGKGKVYQVSPSGALVLVSGEACKDGWRLATREDIAAAAAAEEERKAREGA